MKRGVLTGLILGLCGLITLGTVFFRWVEGWGWIDAYFFTVVTISTVGYGDLVPQTNLGKIGATVFILFGIGLFVVLIQHIGHRALRRGLDKDGNNPRD